MREKEPIVCNTDYGKDEDSAEVSVARACRCLCTSINRRCVKTKCCLCVLQCILSAAWLQALLKKHEALMSDIDAYGGVIDQLREQAQACKVRAKQLVFLQQTSVGYHV